MVAEPILNVRGWRLLAASLMLALTLPRMWQEGMFIDGITYAVVARNMALGFGSLWAPSFSDTIYSVFHEQPPLGMALQSLAFRLFGDHFSVERSYSLVVFALNGLLVAGLWRRLLPRSYDWLPIVIWMVPSVVTWAVINNMLENTQAVFTNVACYALLSTAASSRMRSVMLAVVAAISVAAAVLVKGPVGLFPLALPVLMQILPRSARPRDPHVVWSTFAASLAAVAAVLIASDGPREAMGAFIRSHLTPALAGDRGVGPLGWDFSRHLALGIWMRMAVVAAVVWLIWWIRRRGDRTPLPWRAAAFFFATALAASLPILVSPVLAGHYFVPSMPLFALAFASVTLPAIAAYRSQPRSLSWRVPTTVSAFLTVATVGIIAIHGSLEIRNRELVGDLHAIRGVAPAGVTVGSCPDTAAEWGLLNYLQRFYRISVSADGAPRSGWFLTRSTTCPVPPNCTPVGTTTEFTLLRCEP